jgi:predicted nucleic acid-binding protein
VEALRDRELILTFVTVGEVLHGRMKKGWGELKLQQEIDRLLAYRTISGTSEVAQSYGLVARWFADQAPDNDLWIAACALATQLPVATGDAKHFDPISDRLGFAIVRPAPA